MPFCCSKCSVKMDIWAIQTNFTGIFECLAGMIGDSQFGWMSFMQCLFVWLSEACSSCHFAVQNVQWKWIFVSSGQIPSFLLDCCGLKSDRIPHWIWLFWTFLTRPRRICEWSVIALGFSANSLLKRAVKVSFGENPLFYGPSPGCCALWLFLLPFLAELSNPLHQSA